MLVDASWMKIGAGSGNCRIRLAAMLLGRSESSFFELGVVIATSWLGLEVAEI